ncbi:MAG: PAS domain-containing protein [Lentisphaerae bacterium]|nr:PAS domain-containing protein [Lentisphaerota bacterium]
MDKRQIILIVGDETRERDALSDLMQQEGYRALTAATCEQALDLARKHAPAVALVDLWLADLPGHVVLHGLRQVAPDTECIALLTNPAQQEGAIEALKLGAFTYIRRGLDYRQLLVTIRRALEKRETARALEDVKQRLAILFDAMPAGVLIIDDRTGAVVDANPAAVTIIGAPRAEIVGSILQSRTLGAEPRPATAPETDSAAPSPAMAEVTPPATRQTGRRIPTTRTVATLMIGGRRHRLESFIDVSGRMEVEDQLAAEQVITHMLLEGVPDLVMTVAPSDTVMQLYQGGTGAGAATTGSDAAALLPVELRDRYRLALRDLFRTGRPAVFSGGTPPFSSWSVRLDPVESHGEVLAAAVRARDLAGRERDALRLQVRDAAVSHSHEPLLVLNTDGLVVDANDASARMLDYGPTELIGVPFQQIDHPDEPQPWSRLWAAAAAHPHYTYASRHMTRDGRQLPVQVTLYHTAGAGTAMVLAFIRDVSESERTASIVDNVDARETGLLNALRDPVWVLNRAGVVQGLNEAAARACSRTIDQARGLAYDRLLPEDVARPRMRRVEDVFIRGTPFNFEDHANQRRFEVQVSPIRDRHGTVILAAIVVRDVTDMHAQATRLEQVREQGPLGLIDLDLARVADGLITADSLWRREPELFLQEQPERVAALVNAVNVTDANAQALSLLRLAGGEALRDGLGARLPEFSARMFAAAILRLLAGSLPRVTLELTLTGDDGAPVHASLHVIAQPGPDGTLRHAQLLMIDREARHQAQTDVIDASLLERRRTGEEIGNLVRPLLDTLAETARQLATGLAGGEAAASAANALVRDAQALRDTLERAVQDVGRSAPEDVGLIAALGRLGDEARARWGVTCRSNLRTAGLVLDRTRGVHLHAIASEAVDYAARRRGAKHISITMSASPREGTLTIKNDGSAPAPDEPEDVAERLIRVHADMIQGTVETERDPRGSNTLTCRFPNG